jgi:hypothetical protein
MIENDFRERNKILTKNFIIKDYWYYSFFEKYINEILEHLYNKFILIFREDENLYNKNITNKNSDYYKEMKKICSKYDIGKDIKKDFYERNEMIVDDYISKNYPFLSKKIEDKIKKELYDKFIDNYVGENEKVYNAQMIEKQSDYYEELKKICNKYIDNENNKYKTDY